jgi:nicotinamide-nucleotide amidase
MNAMRAEILTIGSELTSGATVNTNAAFLARRLAEAGLPCQRQTTVGDGRADLARALREALSRCDLLVTTGGLGPTFDDLTMEVIAEVTQRPLVVVPAVAARVRRFYTKHHRKLQQAALRQALLPKGGTALDNPIGTAPGLWLPLPGRLLVALPGVPSEMRAIMDRSVLPHLRRLGQGQVIETRTLRTVGIVELSIQAALRTIRVPSGIEIGLYPSLRMVDVRLTATGSSARKVRQSLRRVENALRRKLGRTVYGTDEEALEEVIGALLVRHRKTLAVAESCTGGLVSDRLTNVSGSSRYLRGSVVAYHNDLKRSYLGVPAQILARFGAVSAQTAKAMAQGIRRMAGADIGLSITGIAGPTGGTKQKPVGLVYLALSHGRTTRVQRCHFFGDRLSIKMQAAQSALDSLRLSLLSS